ncbi:MAG: hypothetical protein ACOC5T_05650 [Elusimicrobiota bacterium]
MPKKPMKYTSRRSRLLVRRWRKTMKGVPVFIIGNGCSVTDEPIADLLKNCFTIGVNRSFKVMETTILLWQDIEFWHDKKVRKKLPKIKSIKYCRSSADPRGLAYHFKLMAGPFKLPPNPMTLFGFGATGPLAFQLAYALGCYPITLIGFDCKYKNGKTDFYGINPDHKKHTLANCTRGLRWIMKCNELSHVKVINCSDNSIFRERRSVKEVVESLPDKHKNYTLKQLSSLLFMKKDNKK